MAMRPGLGKQDTLVAVTTTSFDISVLELFLPLMTGARLVIASNEDVSHGERLMRLLERHDATVMQATPATWRMLIDAGWRGAAGFRAFCGGESLSPELARELLERCSEVWNLYGPTETTVWSSCSRVTDADAPMTVGRPVANTKIYVVDAKLALLPPGVPGEICIGGAGVARGYHGSDELTAERFVADPFCLNGRSRMYRTGDLGRWDSDGNLQHLGRLDSQVKIRGFRMELGEIERVLSKHDSISAAACRVWEPQKGDQRLVAYIVCRDGHSFKPTEVRKHLRAFLPDYMIPQILQPIDELPLTPNGKLDRNALPGPADTNKVLTGKEEPASAEERTIADIWKEIIGVSEVDRRDNFFELGGHSLLALRAAAAMEKRLGAPVELRHIILENLAQLAGRLQPTRVDPGRANHRGLLARLLRS
jgi:acyl-CoA synthetase (AMP-forming)/AMP-acid ligase II